MRTPMVQLFHRSTEIQILMNTFILVYIFSVSVCRENGNDEMLILKLLKFSKYTYIYMNKVFPQYIPVWLCILPKFAPVVDFTARGSYIYIGYILSRVIFFNTSIRY